MLSLLVLSAVLVVGRRARWFVVGVAAFVQSSRGGVLHPFPSSPLCFLVLLMLFPLQPLLRVCVIKESLQVCWLLTPHSSVCPGVYGDVMRVKILFNKKETALVQMCDSTQAQLGKSRPHT